MNFFHNAQTCCAHPNSLYARQHERKNRHKKRIKRFSMSASRHFLLKRFCTFLGSDRTNVCWVKEGCQSLKPKACSSLPLEVVDQANAFSADKLNFHLNTGCYSGNENNLQAQLNNAPASCNPPCFRIRKPGTYCYMGTRNNNFSNRRHVGQITVTGNTPAK